MYVYIHDIGAVCIHVCVTMLRVAGIVTVYTVTYGIKTQLTHSYFERIFYNNFLQEFFYYT